MKEITRILNEEQTSSFWLLNHQNENEQKQNSDVSKENDDFSVNFVVIGGGITGISTAYYLAKYYKKIEKSLKQQLSKNKNNNQINNAKYNILVIESQKLSSRATGRNGGHLRASTRSTAEVEFFEREGISQFLHFCEKKNIQCEHHQTGHLYLAKTTEENQNCIEFIKSRNNSTSFEYWDQSRCNEELIDIAPPGTFLGAIYDKTASQVWASKYVLQTAELCSSLGVKILEDHIVEEVIDNEDESKLKVYNREQQTYITIQTSFVIHATNGYVGYLLDELKGLITPTRGQVLVTKELPRLSFKYAMGFGDGSEYFIQRVEDKRVVFGGRRSAQESDAPIYSDASISPLVSKALREFLTTNFPLVFSNETIDSLIEFEWTGVMGFTIDKKPVIGKIRNNHFVCAGFSGHGMPRVFITGKIAAQMVIELYIKKLKKTHKIIENSQLQIFKDKPIQDLIPSSWRIDRFRDRSQQRKLRNSQSKL